MARWTRQHTFRAIRLLDEATCIWENISYTGVIGYVAVAAGPEYTFSCYNGNCQTDLDQGQDSWTSTIDCDDGAYGEWSRIRNMDGFHLRCILRRWLIRFMSAALEKSWHLPKSSKVT